SQASPALVIANPAATVSLAPTRSAIRSAGTAPRTRPPMMGSRRMPEPCGSRPSTPWEYCGRVDTIPIRARPPTAARNTPQVKAPGREEGGTNGRPPAGSHRQPPLPGEEASDHDHAGGEDGQRRCVGPAVAAQLDQTVDDAAQPHAGCQHADGV